MCILKFFSFKQLKKIIWKQHDGKNSWENFCCQLFIGAPTDFNEKYGYNLKQHTVKTFMFKKLSTRQPSGH